MLEVAHDQLYLDNPHAILETFLVFQQTPGSGPVGAHAARAVQRAQVMDARFRRDPVNRELFMDILQQPQGITHALRLMNQTSVLGRYLWVFRRIVGRMQHDLFHVYTVDQHILMVLRNVRRFFIPEHAHEYPFCSQLAGQWDKPWLLYVAALFHDVAKGRGGDHSVLGAPRCAASAATTACARRHRADRVPGAAPPDDEPHRAEGGPERPEVIAASPRWWARAAPDRAVPADGGRHPRHQPQGLERLEGQAAGGPVPADAARAGRRHGPTWTPRSKPASRRRGRTWRCTRALPGTEEPLWKTLEVSYFARHDAADIAWHARSLWRHLDPPRAGRARAPSPDGRRPAGAGVFARPARPVRAHLRLLRRRRLQHPGRQGAHHARRLCARHLPGGAHAGRGDDDHDASYRDLISLVETQAAQALASDGPLPEPARGRVSRRVRSLPGHAAGVAGSPTSARSAGCSPSAASDRSGLLYAIARVLARHRINLQLAKISTLGERVEDTFLVDGPELQQPKAQLRIETESLLDAVARRALMAACDPAPAIAAGARMPQAGFDAWIDARSAPAEFAEDHLPGAVNWPVLDDEQRRVVGTLYVQVSALEARKLGAALAARNIAATSSAGGRQAARLAAAGVLLARRPALGQRWPGAGRRSAFARCS
jgi:[protein-PII] uridylyltransferase